MIGHSPKMYKHLDLLKSDDPIYQFLTDLLNYGIIYAFEEDDVMLENRKYYLKNYINNDFYIISFISDTKIERFSILKDQFCDGSWFFEGEKDISSQEFVQFLFTIEKFKHKVPYYLDLFI